MAKTESVTAQMTELLDDFNQELQDLVDQSAKEVAKDCVTELKNTSPKRPGRGEYARSWSSKKIDGAWVVFNKKHYRLTHLLENGHVSANQFGTGYTRVPAIKHIQPVEQSGIQEFQNRIMRGL